MSQQTKKNLTISRSSVGHVITSRARFARSDTDLNFAYFHSMDIWQKTELDLRRQIKKIRVQEKIKKS
ncbi:MAG: hypothetical protein ACOYL6_13515 [Bacteriovoracaceae bacterium]